MEEALAIQNEKTRREDRRKFSIPEFIYAEFKLEARSYNLKIFNISRYGLGLIVTHKDFVLLDSLKVGDTLEHITFYATWTMINVNAIVRHKTKISKGKYQGCYIFGIESDDIIESCKPGIS